MYIPRVNHLLPYGAEQLLGAPIFGLIVHLTTCLICVSASFHINIEMMHELRYFH